jgi:hypothetical protein
VEGIEKEFLEISSKVIRSKTQHVFLINVKEWFSLLLNGLEFIEKKTEFEVQ